MRRQLQHAAGRNRSGKVAACAQRHLQRIGGLVIGNDDDDGRIRRARKQWNVQRTRGRRQ